VQGVENGAFIIEYPLELAELWSREVMHFYRKSRRAILGQEEQLNAFSNWLRFTEQLINHQLGLKPATINIVELGRTYVELMQGQRGEAHD